MHPDTKSKLYNTNATIRQGRFISLIRSVVTIEKSLDPNSVRLSNICTTASYDINRPKENRV